MGFRLAVSSNGFKKHSFAAAVDIAAAIGYAGIEVLGEPPHLYAGVTPDEEIAAAREKILAAGLRVSNVNAFTLEVVGGDFYHPSFIEKKSAHRKIRTDYTMAAARMTRMLGAKNLSIEPGGPLERGMTRKDAYALFAECLGEIEPVLAAEDVRLLIEPEPELLIERMDEMREFFDFHDHPLLGVNFDIGHVFCVGEDPAVTVRKMRDKIGHVHIEDIAPTRVHRHLVPGDGAIDYRPVFEALAEIGYTGFVTVELYPYGETAGDVSRRAWEFFTSKFGEFFC